MSAICSSHNLIQFEQLNFDLSIHYYALRLLDSVSDEDRKDAWNRLLFERISVMDDTVRCLDLLEDCIRAGRDFNSDSPNDEPSPDDPAWLV